MAELVDRNGLVKWKNVFESTECTLSCRTPLTHVVCSPVFVFRIYVESYMFIDQCPANLFYVVKHEVNTSENLHPVIARVCWISVKDQ